MAELEQDLAAEPVEPVEPAVTGGSAPSEVEPPGTETPPEPERDRVQERINTITREKYEAKREADQLRQQLEQARQQQAAPADAAAPTLEQFDYDESQYNQAFIEYVTDKKVREATSQMQQQQSQQSQQAAQADMIRAYTERIGKSGLEDFQATVAPLESILTLDAADAIMMDENGPQVAHYLGKNLDAAERIAGLSPVQAAVEIGKLSAKLSGPRKKPKSNALPPVKPAGSGGGGGKSVADMSAEEIEAMLYPPR